MVDFDEISEAIVKITPLDPRVGLSIRKQVFPLTQTDSPCLKQAAISFLDSLLLFEKALISANEEKQEDLRERMEMN